MVTEQEIKNNFISEGYIVKDIKFLSNSGIAKINFICPSGHHHNVLFINWKYKKTRCAKCAGNARISLRDIKTEFELEGYKLLTSHYKNNQQKLNFICKNNHNYFITYDKWKQGYRCRKCYNERQSMSFSGSGNPAWKGGIACEPYCEQWIDQDYKDSIKERDGYKCLNSCCSKISKNLNIHHIDYIKKNCHPNNLITLCISCNAKANFNRDWHQAWYEAIIYRRYNMNNLYIGSAGGIHD